MKERKAVKNFNDAWIHRTATLLLAVCCVALIWKDWRTQVRLNEMHEKFDEKKESYHLQQMHQLRHRPLHARFKRSVKQELPQKPSKDTSQLSPMTSVTIQQLEPYCLELARQCAAHKFLVGPPGKTGPPGSIGMTGATGPAGKPGEKGATGSIGPIGLPGREGPAGPPGPQGQKGEKGLLGLRGKTGAIGKTGSPGKQGEKGEKGTCTNKEDKMCKQSGQKGERGLPGERGLVGMRGPQGPPGFCANHCKNGEPGHKGAKGEPGNNGVCVKIDKCVQEKYIVTNVLDGGKETSGANNANYRNASATATVDYKHHPDPSYQPTYLKEQPYRELPHQSKSSTGITHRIVNHINQQAIEIAKLPYDENAGFWTNEVANRTLARKAVIQKEETVWITIGTKGSEIIQYAGATALRRNKIDVHHKLPYFYYGTNHAVQRGHVIYHQYNHNCLVRYNFATRESQRLEMPQQAAYRVESHSFLYQSQPAFFDIEVVNDDEIWVIYKDKHVSGVTYAVLVDTGKAGFQITRKVKLDVDSTKYEQGFVVNGVLYFVRKLVQDPSWMLVDLVYELRQSMRHQWAPLLRFQIPIVHQSQVSSSSLSMLSYQARENQLYAWFRGHLLAYPITVVHF